MSPIIIIAFAIVTAVVLECRFHINMGISCICFSFLIGNFILGMTADALIQLMPVKMIFTIIAITLFYGFALENGTMHKIIEILLYRFRNRGFLIPVVIFMSCIFLGIIGIGAPSITAIMAPIAMAIVCTSKMDPIIAVGAVSCGSCIGGNFIFSQGGIIVRGIIETTIYREEAMGIALKAFIGSAIVFTAAFALIYFLGGGYRFNLPRCETPEPFSKKQKQTLMIILFIVSMMIVPSMFGYLIHSETLLNFSRRLDVGFLMFAGAFIESVLQLADSDSVIRQRIPYKMLLIISGVSMLMGIAKEAGIIELLGNMVQESIPQSLVAVFLVVAAGMMSCFSSSTSVVVPMLFPLVPTLAVHLGLNPALLFGAVFIGATGTGCSPFSTGGGLLLSSCPCEAKQESLLLKMILLPFVNTIISSLLCYIYFFLL